MADNDEGFGVGGWIGKSDPVENFTDYGNAPIGNITQHSSAQEISTFRSQFPCLFGTPEESNYAINRRVAEIALQKVSERQLPSGEEIIDAEVKDID